MHSLNYLKTARKQSSLSQEELGVLIGNGSHLRRSSVYRLEEGVHSPTISVAIGCEVIFGKRISAVFPDFYGDIESVVVGRAERMHRSLRDETDERSKRKRGFLAGIIERAKQRMA